MNAIPRNILLDAPGAWPSLGALRSDAARQNNNTLFLPSKFKSGLDAMRQPQWRKSMRPLICRA